MGKLEALVAMGISTKEIIDGIQDFFNTSIPDTYYDSLDKLAFLDCKMLGITSDGYITDSTKVIGEAICNLSNLVVWGILLFYLFLSLFGYFWSKRMEIPWQIFIRIVICGVLINSAFFIAYSGVYLIENTTDYIVEYCGGNTSFSYMEERVSTLDIVVDEEIKNILVMDELLKVSMYVSVFFLNIVLGIRYVLIKFLVLFLPVIIAFGCSKITEKIFFKSVKLLAKLLLYQVFMVVFLEIAFKMNFISDTINKILSIGIMWLCIGVIKKMCENY